MTTATPTLPAFISERLDEWEATARAASAGPWWVVPDRHRDDGSLLHVRGPHHYPDDYLGDTSDLDPTNSLTADYVVTGDEDAIEDLAHIAANDPARVLATVTALREIVARGQFSDSDESAVEFWMAESPPGRTPPQPLGELMVVMKLLAAIWADHDDYRAEWSV